MAVVAAPSVVADEAPQAGGLSRTIARSSCRHACMLLVSCGPHASMSILRRLKLPSLLCRLELRIELSQRAG